MPVSHIETLYGWSLWFSPLNWAGWTQYGLVLFETSTEGFLSKTCAENKNWNECQLNNSSYVHDLKSIVTNWKKTKRPKDLNCQLSIKGLPTGILIHIYTYIWKEIPCPRIIKLTVFLIYCTQFICVEDLKKKKCIFTIWLLWPYPIPRIDPWCVGVYEIYK